MIWTPVRRFCRRAFLAALGIALLNGSVALPGEMRAPGSFARQTAAYDPPRVSLVDSSGRTVPLADLLGGNRPVVLEFFYTTCTTICGLQSSSLSNARAALGDNCTLISISIDPEFDTAAKLRAYARIYQIKSNWHLLTGRRADIQAVLTAFDARPYGDNKMLHKPYVFIHTAPDRQWIRLEGLLSGPEIVGEYREALRHPPPVAAANNGIVASLLRWAGK
jgi:protein SCO1/2